MSGEYGLHRSVHPHFFSDGEVGMEAFSPTSEENYELSIDCEKVWLAKISYEFRTRTLGKKSLGIWTVPRIFVTGLNLPIKADVKADNPAHSLLVFPKQDKAKRRDAARRLASYANSASFSRTA